MVAQNANISHVFGMNSSGRFNINKELAKQNRQRKDLLEMDKQI